MHSAVDVYSRVAYSEVLANEQGATAAEFWCRAAAYFAALGIVIERVLTDNGPCYRGRVFNHALGTITHTYTAPTDPRPTAKSNDSTERCSPNGPTPDPGTQTASAPSP